MSEVPVLSVSRGVPSCRRMAADRARTTGSRRSRRIAGVRSSRRTVPPRLTAPRKRSNPARSNAGGTRQSIHTVACSASPSSRVSAAVGASKRGPATGSSQRWRTSSQKRTAVSTAFSSGLLLWQAGRRTS